MFIHAHRGRPTEGKPDRGGIGAGRYYPVVLKLVLFSIDHQIDTGKNGSVTDTCVLRDRQPNGRIGTGVVMGLAGKAAETLRRRPRKIHTKGCAIREICGDGCVRKVQRILGCRREVAHLRRRLSLIRLKIQGNG